MLLVSQIIVILLMVLGPRVMVLLSNRFKVLGALGPVFLCYAAGFLFSYILPDTSLAMTIAEVLVPIAIPLILFSADLKSVKHLAKPSLHAFLLMILSVLAVSVAAFFIFRNRLEDANKLSGMIIGLYTGGTPNLIAIGLALNLDSSKIVLANTVDVVVGGVYFLLLISIMPRFVNHFLKPFKSAEVTNPANADIYAEQEKAEEEFVPKKAPFKLRVLLQRMPAILVAAACLAAAAGLALLLTGEMNVAIIMLVVTTLGVAFSFIKKIRECPGSFSAGQYLIYMFSFGIGLSFDLSGIQAEMLSFLAMFALAQFGAVALHLILCRFARIDGHTALITSTAGIYGPAFIVPAANALNNREVVLPGLVCGILGYAVGNYLGIGTAYLLASFL